MKRSFSARWVNAAVLVLSASALLSGQSKYARDPKQPVDEEYTKKIKEYTTAPFFLSPLVDYLPASKTVPTPKAVLGDVAGAPGKLPYSAQVHEYMRMLEKASPRVKVLTIGKIRGRPRDDRGGHRRRPDHREDGREPRATGEAGRPAHDQDGRCRGGSPGGSLHAHLLHHRLASLARDRRADRADGTRLPARGGRGAVHQGDPRRTSSP